MAPHFIQHSGARGLQLHRVTPPCEECDNSQESAIDLVTHSALDPNTRLLPVHHFLESGSVGSSRHGCYLEGM